MSLPPPQPLLSEYPSYTASDYPAFPPEEKRSMEDNGAEVLLAERRHAVQRARGPELRRSRGTYVTRLILRYISAITSIAIIGVLADAIRSYKKTQHVTNPYRDGHGRFPVWPEGLKLRPTWMLLGVAVVAAITSTLLCIASFSSAVRRMTKAGNIFTVIISTISLTLWIAVTGYYAAWDTKKTNFDLLSWTCKHSDPEYNYNNIDFNETCMEMRFAKWAAVGLAALEFFNLGMFILWAIRSKSSRGYEKMGGSKESNSGMTGARIGGLLGSMIS